MKILIGLLCMGAMLLTVRLYGQTLPSGEAAGGAAAAVVKEEDPESAKAIGEARNGIIDSFNKGDIDKLVTFLHPDIVVTWADGEVSHGPAEVRKYHEKMMGSANGPVKSLKIKPVVEGRQMYGPNVAISYGSLGDEFLLNDGTQFVMNSRFSSLLVKENGKWLLKGFHASGNIFDNPIQKLVVKRASMWVGGMAAIMGIALGYLAGRMKWRRKAAPAA